MGETCWARIGAEYVEGDGGEDEEQGGERDGRGEKAIGDVKKKKKTKKRQRIGRLSEVDRRLKLGILILPVARFNGGVDAGSGWWGQLAVPGEYLGRSLPLGEKWHFLQVP